MITNIVSIHLGFSQSSPPVDDYYFELITTENGLSNNAVCCFLKDSRGFLWIGTQNGLNRYDAYEFKKYYHRANDLNSLSDNYILTLYEDSHGLIWVGTMYGGINCIHPGNDSIARYPLSEDDPYTLRESQVFAICEDNQGDIWFAAHLPQLQHIYKIDRETDIISGMMDFAGFEQDQNIHSHHMIKDAEGDIWIGFQLGIIRINPETNMTSQYLLEPVSGYPLGTEGMTLYEDLDGMIWCGSFGGGLYRFNSQLEQFDLIIRNEQGRNLLSENRIASISGDKKGTLYINTLGGTNILDIRSGKIRSFIFPKGLQAGNYLIQKSGYFDESGLLWLGMVDERDHPAGILKIYLNKKKFILNSKGLRDLSSQSNFWISSVETDLNGNLFMGTTKGLLYKALKDSTTIEYFPWNKYGLPATIIGTVSEVYLDREDKMWIGNWEDGTLFKIDTSGYELFPGSGTNNIDLFRNAPYNLKIDYFLRYDDILFTGAGSMRIYELDNQCLLIGRGTGLEYFDPSTGVFSHVSLVPDSIEYHDLPLITSIEKDKTGNIWIGTMHLGLFRMSPDFKLNENGYLVPGDLISFKLSNKYPGIPRDMMVTSLCVPAEDNDTDIWVGTYGSGLIGISSKNGFSAGFSADIKTVTSDEGLSNNIVFGILEDQSGDLWISTKKGLNRLSAASGAIRIYGESDGLTANEFDWLSSHKSRDGTMFFGTTDGLVQFHPDSILENQQIPPVMITDVKLYNKPTPVSLLSSIEHTSSGTERLELSHRDNYLSFEFTALNFVNSEQNQYQYMLEGLDRQWIRSGKNRIATYSNIRPGRYTFRVLGSNNDGIWNNTGASMLIRVSPPPWFSWYAYALYALLFMALVYWYRNYLIRQTRLRSALELEKLEKEKVLEIDRMKSRFFSNISHEFRTPLTLLLGPINDLMRTRKENDPEKNILDTMKRNANRLYQLISQLLDLSRIEGGKLGLQVERGNPGQHLRGVASSFQSLAETQGINYIYQIEDPSFAACFDRDKTEKILSNLITNALKFTPPGGTVHVEVKYHHINAVKNWWNMTVLVSDTGVGISKDDQDQIFNRFYQVGNEDGLVEGTGIGLSLTKELVEIYRGKITCESTPGKGTTFSVQLPASCNLFTSEERVTVPESGTIDSGADPYFADSDLHKDNETLETDTGDSDRHVILVIEDNPDLRKYVTDKLVNEFQILEADNGTDGETLAYGHIPDLIISDLMMPGMDGITLCKRLKSDQRTNHVPVILLTARADRYSKLEGLQTGADDYLLKPFDSEELLIRVNNLIRQRSMLRMKYRQEFHEDAGYSENHLLQDPLIRKALQIIGSNLHDDRFGVEQLGDQVGLSRSQLYRKFMAVTGISPSELIRNVRLKEAARLFREEYTSVSAAMYAVGFNSQSNFAKYFKNLYGMNPRDYVKQHSQRSS